MLFKKRGPDVHALITAQIRDVEKCMLIFEDFMTAAANCDDMKSDVLRAMRDKIDLAEDDADLSLRTMIDSLRSAPYLPATKADLIAIATSCDKIANKCETVATRIVTRRIACPKIYVDDILKIFAITKDQFQMLEECISMLFSKMNVLAAEPEHLAKIRALESQVDKLEEGIYEHLFDSDMDLAEKTQIARVVELLCDLSDIVEDIADKIQIMLITRMA